MTPRLVFTPVTLAPLVKISKTLQPSKYFTPVKIHFVKFQKQANTPKKYILQLNISTHLKKKYSHFYIFKSRLYNYQRPVKLKFVKNFSNFWKFYGVLTQKWTFLHQIQFCHKLFWKSHFLKKSVLFHWSMKRYYCKKN